MKKIIFFAVLVMCLPLAPLNAQAADDAGDMAVGAWTVNPRYVTFGAYKGFSLVWRVLEVKDNDMDFGGIKTAFLLLDDLLRDSNGNVEIKTFDPKNNYFPASEIKNWLNDGENGFLAVLGAYQADILDTTYSADNASRKWPSRAPSGASKVYMLSVGESNNGKYFASDADRSASRRWWLRSPGYGKDIATSVQSFGGVAGNGPYVYGDSGVRPALKISLSPSSVFAAVPVSYVLAVNVNDGSNPIPGAKVSLVPYSERNAEIFSDSVGKARFANVTPGEYTVTLSKPGYETESQNVTVPGTPVISLTIDPTALPAKVKFGKYDGVPINWDVLDVVDGKALLFAEPLFQSNFDIGAGSGVWKNSSLRALLNNSDTGGFLQAANFTADEAAAIDASASAAGDSVFLLSINEAHCYLPDANMRRFDAKEWLTRTPIGNEDVQYINVDGEYGGGIPAYYTGILCWVRPAMWVDLNALSFDLATGSLVIKSY